MYLRCLHTTMMMFLNLSFIFSSVSCSSFLVGLLILCHLRLFFSLCARSSTSHILLHIFILCVYSSLYDYLFNLFSALFLSLSALNLSTIRTHIQTFKYHSTINYTAFSWHQNYAIKMRTKTLWINKNEGKKVNHKNI